MQRNRIILLVVSIVFIILAVTILVNKGLYFKGEHITGSIAYIIAAMEFAIGVGYFVSFFNLRK